MSSMELCRLNRKRKQKLFIKLIAKLFCSLSLSLAYDTNNKSSNKNLRIGVRNAVIIKNEIVFSDASLLSFFLPCHLCKLFLYHLSAVEMKSLHKTELFSGRSSAVYVCLCHFH